MIRLISVFDVLSWVLRSWLSWSLLNVSFGIMSKRYLVVPKGVDILDVGGVEWKASAALLLSFRNSSDACRDDIAISCDFSVFPSSRINPWK